MSSWCCSTATAAVSSSGATSTACRAVCAARHRPPPNGDSFAVSISGGVAWYPEDRNDGLWRSEIRRFMMYQIKRSHEGGMQEFTTSAYNEALPMRLRSAQEFEQMLAEETA